MSWSLLRKTFNDARWLLLACVGVIFAFSWIRVFIVASIELYQFQRLARNLPDMIQRLAPSRSTDWSAIRAWSVSHTKSRWPI